MAETKDDTVDESGRGKRPRTEVNAAVEERQLNFIQIAPDSADSSTGKPKRDKKARAADKNSVEAASREKSAEPRASRVPDSVHERFIHIGNNFYFPDGAEAFSREPGRLTTRSENAIVIQSMVAIARAESESGVVKVGGSEFFKKEAWFAANLAGLEVQGYTPTEFERERLVRAMAARHGTKPTDQGPEAEKEKSLNTNELISGRLVDHGPAPYKHNPKEPMSYFVRIETEKGDRDIWGVDLERAFRHSLSNPGIGDQVGLRPRGKEPVTVLAEGRELDTHRNQWSVERKDFLDQRRDMAAVFREASISAAEGIRRHPGLEGSYRTLEMGQAHAEEQYTSKAHRSQFVDHLRDYVARTIEYGQALEPARPPAREDRTFDPRESDGDYHPTR
jgi:conjugative element/phage-associated large polyvalent protein